MSDTCPLCGEPFDASLPHHISEECRTRPWNKEGQITLDELEDLAEVRR